MMKPPLNQLIDLCAGYGALPSQIVKVAPFLETLAATKHAQTVLHPNDDSDWPHAARQLLICVTKPGGAADFDERNSRFARACLGLSSNISSFTGRMNELANDEIYDYPTAPNTWIKSRRNIMSILDGVLRQLSEYPCAPRAAKHDALDRAVVALLQVVRLPEYYSNDPAGLREMRDDLFERLFPRAYKLFDLYEPDANAYRRLQLMVLAVAENAYSEVFTSLLPQSGKQLFVPGLLPRLFEGEQQLADPNTPIVHRTVTVIARILLHIENRNEWERLLLAAAAVGEEDFKVSPTELLLVRSYLEQFGDDS